MQKHQSILKKLAAGTLMVLIVSGSFFAVPKKSEAFIVTDLTNLVQNTASAIADVDSVFIRRILDGIAWGVAKTVVNSLTASIVNWINSGFQGSPAFVSDLKENLTYLGDAIADDFVDRLDQNIYDNTGFSIRTPFQTQIADAVRQEYYRTTASWGLDYTLNQYSSDPKAFIDGEFRQGGFSALYEASQNDNNNPFGAYRRAQDEMWAQIGQEQQRRKSELDWGKGFLPWRGPCAVTGTGSAVDLSKAEKCPFNEVRTPGTVIEDQLAHTLGSGVRQLELADSFNEIVGALIGQLTNQVLGVVGLSGVSRPSAGGGSSYVDRTGSASQLSPGSSSLADGVLNNIEMERKKVDTYMANWRKIQGAAQSALRCGSGTLANEALQKATVALSKGSAANAKLNEIEQKVRTAVANTNSKTGAAAITTAVSEYQSYLSSSAMPGAQEIAEAAGQASDTGSSNGGSMSLYTQLKMQSTSCRGG